MCTANIVRSPFAERYLARRVSHGVEVTSRGVLAAGTTCPPDAIEAAALHGIDLQPHRARLLTTTELLHSQLVITMELRMAHELAVRYPSIQHIIAPLGYFDEAGQLSDVVDPFMQERSKYVRCYDHIARCCDGLLHQMRAE